MEQQNVIVKQVLREDPLEGGPFQMGIGVPPGAETFDSGFFPTGFLLKYPVFRGDFSKEIGSIFCQIFAAIGRGALKLGLNTAHPAGDF